MPEAWRLLCLQYNAHVHCTTFMIWYEIETALNWRVRVPAILSHCSRPSLSHASSRTSSLRSGCRHRVVWGCRAESMAIMATWIDTLIRPLWHFILKWAHRARCSGPVIMHLHVKPTYFRVEAVISLCVFFTVFPRWRSFRYGSAVGRSAESPTCPYN